MDTIACAMRATCGNGFKCEKDLEQWCSQCQTFWLGWSTTRMLRFAHEFKKMFIKWRHFATMIQMSFLATPLSYIL